MSEHEVSHEPNNPEIIIELAVPEDAEAIMLIKRARWLDTYVSEESGVTEQDIYKKFSDADLAKGIENWRKGIANVADKSRKEVFVAKLNGKVVGYTSPCIELPSGRRRIDSLYVAKEAESMGAGSALIRKAIDWHGRSQDIYLEVVTYNTRAIAFYEHHGFEKNGVELEAAIDPEDGSKLLPEYEMVLKARR